MGFVDLNGLIWSFIEEGSWGGGQFMIKVELGWWKGKYLFFYYGVRWVIWVMWVMWVM